MSPRLAFLGTPDIAVPFLDAVSADGHDVRLVVTQPDRRRSRGSGLDPSPVKAAALRLGLPVSHRVADVVDADVELGVVVAFGRLVKPDVLGVVPMVNVHFSLLPRWRGAAPVERALLAGDAETGVCLMAMEEGLDTGPVHSRRVVPIGPDMTLDDLRGRLVSAGVELLRDGLRDGLGPAEPQEGEPTYAAKIDPVEYQLDWHRPAEELARVVRLGRAWTTFRGRRLRILAAAAVAADLAPAELDGLVAGAGTGGLELLEVQPEGKAPQPAAAWRNGARPTAGERLGT